MTIEVKITNAVRAGNNHQVVEVDSWQKILTKKYLTEVANKIYQNPKVEKTEKGFLISGEAKKRFDVPDFVIDVNLKRPNGKAKVRAKYSVYVSQSLESDSPMTSDALQAFRYSDNIEKILQKYFC